MTRTTMTTSIGGALIALAGLFPLMVLLGIGGGSALIPLGTVALALGALVLAHGTGRAGIVGDSRAGRIALVVFGVAPLTFPLDSAPQPWSVVIGMSIIALVTVATLVTAVSVARTRTLHGVARWAIVVVAIDALLTAVMSSVQLGAIPFVYLAWHLELIRPAALLIWGVSIALHGRGPAIRRRGAALVDAWRRSTDVGGGGGATEADATAPR